MKKKGFTLIELLAVIVILAVIAIISVPIITDLINKSRYGAFGVTKKNIEHAAELYYAKNADDVYWEDNIAYVTIGTLKSKKFLRNNVVNTLDSTSINDDTKVLLYRKGRKIDYSLQLYDKQFFDWYQGQMVQASKKEGITLPTTVGEIVTVDLETLMGKGLVDELRLPLELDSRCVGYVEIEKTTDNYEYNAYVDCLQGASTFASHYVSYGGKYIDEFNDIKETSDGGYIAVGRSNSEVITKYGAGNNGKYDAIIVKFKSNGEVEWSKNFGGSNDDYFYGVVEGNNFYIAVGHTKSSDKDITDFKGGTGDALIVKYDYSGNVISKKAFGTSGNTGTFHSVIINDNQVIVAGVLSVEMNGDLEGLLKPEASAATAINVVFDSNLNLNNIVWFGGSSNDSFQNTIKTSDGGYISVGDTLSTNGNLTGVKCISDVRNEEALIVKYNSEFEIEKAKTLCTHGVTGFRDIIEVNNGYIVVGSTVGADLDMNGLSKANNGKRDAIIVKYDKNLENILWKKSFGGSEDDYFYRVIKINDNEVTVIGYSKSSDLDMTNISKSTGGYSNAIFLKYNATNGDLIKTHVFGGNNSEKFSTGIRLTSGDYILAGSSYSVDKDLRNFNKGNQDAVIVKYDKDLNLKKDLQEPVILIEKLKKINPYYGETLKLSYENIYTSNNPTLDLKDWCTSYEVSGNNNYDYGQCLKPFNDDDRKLLTAIEKPNLYKEMFAGEREYVIDNEPDDPTNWYQIFIRPINSGTVNISNFKIKFSDGYVGSIRESVEDGYLEPLVIVSNIITYPPYSERTYASPIDIIEPNGILEYRGYPVFYINLKSKEKRMVSLIFTTNKDITGAAGGFYIHELRNFDMSITPTE